MPLLFFYLVQYALPPMSHINKDFLRQVFKNEKKLLKKSEIRTVKVPQYDELSVKNLWKDLSKEEQFKIYFPDFKEGDKLPERQFFFDVLNTIFPDYLASIMQHASKQRMAADGEELKKETIELTPEWQEALSSLPFTSSMYPYCYLYNFLFSI